MVNVTWKYFDDDEELSEDITEEEVNTEINSMDDVKVSNTGDEEVNNKECWNDVESDDSLDDNLMPELMRCSDKNIEYDSSDDEYNSDDE